MDQFTVLENNSSFIDENATKVINNCSETSIDRTNLRTSLEDRIYSLEHQYNKLTDNSNNIQNMLDELIIKTDDLSQQSNKMIENNSSIIDVLLNMSNTTTELRYDLHNRLDDLIVQLNTFSNDQADFTKECIKDVIITFNDKIDSIESKLTLLQKETFSTTFTSSYEKLTDKMNNIYDKLVEQEEREKNHRIRNYYMGGAVYPFMTGKPVAKGEGMISGGINSNYM